MGEGEFYYIREVLGLTSVPLPAQMKMLWNQNQARPIFCVYSPFAFSDAELNFAKKMLSAMEISAAEFLNQKDHSSEEILALTQKHSHSYGISFGIEKPLSLHTDWVELPAISQFLDNSDPNELVKIKRQAWTELKKLKMSMEALLN